MVTQVVFCGAWGQFSLPPPPLKIALLPLTRPQSWDLIYSDLEVDLFHYQVNAIGINNSWLSSPNIH